MGVNFHFISVRIFGLGPEELYFLSYYIIFIFYSHFALFYLLQLLLYYLFLLSPSHLFTTIFTIIKYQILVVNPSYFVCDFFFVAFLFSFDLYLLVFRFSLQFCLILILIH